MRSVPVRELLDAFWRPVTRQEFEIAAIQIG
jgi:hypothetical protein